MLRRLSTTIPIVASAVAVALMIVLLASGTNPGNADTNYWLSLNTSKIGQDLIQLDQANVNTSDPIGAIANGLDGLLGGLIGGLSNSIAKGIEDLQGELVGNLTKALGVKGVYSLFVNHICEGEYANPDDPNSAVRITQCYKYHDKEKGLRNISSSIPSSFVIGTTNVTVPLVSALSSSIDSVMDLAGTGSAILFALLIIGVVSIGTSMLGSVMTLLLGFRTVLVWLNMGLMGLGAATMMVFAAVTTGVILGGSSAVAGLGAAFNLQTKQGRPFLIMAWIASVFSVIASTYWTVFWFVETRKTALVRRRRRADEIGNWRDIVRTTMSNLRVPREEHDEQKGRNGRLD